MLCMMTSMSDVVVRLSRLAEIMKVMTDSIHSSLWLLRVRTHGVRKSKHPLLCRISVMVIVARRNSTISAALPTYLRKIFCAI